MKLNEDIKEKIGNEKAINFIEKAKTNNEIVAKYLELDDKHKRLRREYQEKFKDFPLSKLANVKNILENRGYEITTLRDMENAIDRELQSIASDRNALKVYLDETKIDLAKGYDFGGLT